MKTKALIALIVIAVWFAIYAWKAFTGDKQKLQMETQLEKIDQSVAAHKDMLGWFSIGLLILLIVVGYVLDALMGE